jgi:ribose transport system substrate-binding protein
MFDLLKRITLPLIIAVTALSLVTGCGGNSAESEAKYLVIFSQCNNAEPYRAAQNKKMAELFAEHPDIKFEILDAQNDASKQISQIENAILQQPDLLIVAPLNRTALNKPMKDAMDKGLPVICLERDIVDPNYTTFINSDNVAIGRLAGQYILDALKAKNGSIKGNLIELTGSDGVQGANDRHQGAFEVLQPHIDSGAIKVVHTATGNWIKDQAMARMEEAYNATEGNFDVVYAHNDPMAYGAYLVTKEKNPELAEAAIFVGVDGLETEGVKLVRDGQLDATFEYPLCVDKAVELTVKMLEDPDFKPELEYTLPSRAITAETLEQE